MVDEAWKNIRLQRNFSFPNEHVQVRGRVHDCADVKDWGNYMKMNGAWGG